MALRLAVFAAALAPVAVCTRAARADVAVAGAAPSGAATAGSQSAAAVPAPSPSVVGIDPAFLTLPALDIVGQASGARVGDGLLVHVDGLAPGQENFKIAPPPGEKELLDQGWEIQAPPATALPPDRRGKLYFLLVPLKAGHLMLSSLAIGPAEGPAVARTNPFAAEIASSLGGAGAAVAGTGGAAGAPTPPKPADLRPPVGLNVPLWLIVTLLIAALIVLGFAGYGVWRWWRARVARRPVKRAQKLPAAEAALAALDELEKRGALARGEFKPHYFRASEILKAYLGERYGFDALESTADEIVRALEAKGGLSEVLIDRLEAMFRRLDRVKFTDHRPAPDEAAGIVPELREFVLKTRPTPDLAAGAQAGGEGEGPRASR